MSRVLPALAFFSVPMISTDCNSPLTLDVTAPSPVTPEPSTLALIGTGVLGVFGVARRRLRF